MATVQCSVDRGIWKACAGNSVRIPAVGAVVYYFPDGHAEQSYEQVEFSAQHPTWALCRVKTVKFLANDDSDEVFAELRLEPISSPPVGPLSPESDDGEESAIVSFAKTLTPSDANNGGGFSVPRFCADSIFPPLNFSADPPVQTIFVRDVQGVSWKFRHIYRGTPRRHLLTTGWSKFVNEKKLIAGDSVVFMKNKVEELFVGIRRTVRSSGCADFFGQWNRASGKLQDGDFKGFSRSSRGRISAHSVLEAAQLAASGKSFDVVYYPRSGSPDFVVPAHLVNDSLKGSWSVGMRIKMAMETEDSSKMTWFQGSVQAVAGPDDGLRRASPWRMLQVDWDESEALHDVKRVSPWQVEFVSTVLHIQDTFPATKKTRLHPQTEMLFNRDGAMFYPVPGISPSLMSPLSPTVFNHTLSPAGMQGARHYTSFVGSLSNFLQNENEFVSSDKPLNYSAQETNTVCRKLCIGDAPQSEISSSQGQESTNLSSIDTDGNGSHSLNTESSGGSFQLFGQTIYITHPCKKDDSFYEKN